MEEQQLDALVIVEEGDEPGGFTHAKARGVLRVKKEAGEDEADGNSEGSGACKNADEVMSVAREDAETRREDGSGREGGKMEGAREKAEGETQGLKEDAGTKDDALADIQPSVRLRPRERLGPEDAQQTVRRLSPDSPEALFELLCVLQEGRRLNDQRCSFTLQPRRRCHSEPGTPRHSQRVMFSSMTSLQKEEFFDMVASSQARRLDDQRADFRNASPQRAAPLPREPRRPSSAPASFSQHRSKSRRSSWKVMEFGQAAPKPAPKEDLYNMILTSQAQGRLEEQRSKAPGPMDDEDFFSLLLKVQGGRMDEQRTELPLTLRY